MQTKLRERSLISLFLALIVAIGLVPHAAANDSAEQKPISIARAHLKNEKGLRWDKAAVSKVDDNKAWVTVAPDQKQYNGGAQFYRIAVDTEEGVATVQDYRISAPDKKTGTSHARLYADGTLFWSGSVTKSGKVVDDKDTPKRDSTSSRGICDWAMGSLCSTGGGVGCFAACAALGLATGPGGIGCAGACALIAHLGCDAAKKKICG